MHLAVLIGTALVGALLLGACDLDERADFLLGRECEPGLAETCDTNDACLPHTWVGAEGRDFRCRSEASFVSTGESEPPLAYCAPPRYACPGTTVCRADRVRPVPDGGIRRQVCQAADSPFGPPG